MTHVEWQESLLSKFEGRVSLKSGGYNVRCPAHKDTTPSLHIMFTEDKALLKCYAGCSFENILGYAGLSPSDVFFSQNGQPKAPSAVKKEKTPGHEREKPAFVDIDFDHPTKIYSYTDEDGVELYQKCRYEVARNGQRLDKKTFRQRCQIQGKWSYSLKDIRRVPYNFPALFAEPYMIYDCEGEKDADNLIELGVTATSTDKDVFAELSGFCQGKGVVICEDHDDPGKKKAEEKAKAYWDAGAEFIKILSFPEMPEHADVSDWLADGHDIFDLQIRIQDLLSYNPLQDVIVNFFYEVRPRLPLIEIFGRNALTSGNIGGITAGIGVGKSHFFEIIISSAILPGCEPESFVETHIAEGERIALLDTEQPAEECWYLLDRAWRRTGQRPDTRTADKSEFKKLTVFSLLSSDLASRRETLKAVFLRPEYKLILLDGLLDFIANPNDPEESATFITWLHSMAAKYDKGVFCVLHGNRNDLTGKGKGWVGDLFQRKAVCFLMLRKHKVNQGIRVVTTDFDNVKFRKGDDTGINIAMQWDPDFNGFRCIPYIAEDDESKFSAETILARCFLGAPYLSKKDLAREYMRYSRKGKTTAYKHIDESLGFCLEKVNIQGKPMYAFKHS